MNTMEENTPIMDVNSLVDEATNALKPALTEFAKTIITGKTEPIKEEESFCNDKQEVNITSPELNKIPGIAEDIKELLEQVTILIEDDKKFNKMHEELDEHRKGLYRKLLSPVLKNIVIQYSKISDLYNFYNKKQTEENADKSELFSNLLKEYQNLQLSLSDLLYEYDIEIVEPKVGEEFNPKKHKAIKIIPTEQTELDRTIAACVTLGFKDMPANEQIIKYPEVEIFKLNQSNG